jgi:hypothetical protein
MGRNDSLQVQSVSVIRLKLEYLGIESRRLRESSGTVVSKGGLQ